MFSFPKSTFNKRREKVILSMADDSILIIESAKHKTRNGDNDYPYKQDSNFFYLTGYNVDNCILMLIKTKSKTDEVLFVEENNSMLELWTGRKPSVEEVKEKTGVKNVSLNKEFNMYLRSVITVAQSIYIDYSPIALSSPLSFEHEKIKTYREHFPNLTSVLPVSSILYSMRAIKDKDEVEALSKAIDITKQGLINAMNKVEPGMYEYEVQADIEYMYMKNNCRMPAFPSIVAAGVNAATLHYTTNNSVIEQNDLILTDIGAEFMNYSADITRVFPAGGKFKGKAKDLYQEMHLLQEEIISWCKPGASMADINNNTGKLIGKLLKSFKYIKDEMDYKKYYAHSVGHMLGLDTHDVNAQPRPMHVLKKGMVLTIEPGIYIPEDKIGIRIEDDILITEKGNRNLSKDIPKTIKEIEKVMEG